VVRPRRAAITLVALAALCSFAAGSGRATDQRALRVGYVAFGGEVPGTRTLSGLLLLGFLKAERKLGIDGQVFYVSPTQDTTSLLETLARRHFDLIVVAFPDPAPVDVVARAFPRVHFVMVDIPLRALDHRPRNVEGSVFRAEEAGYLAGYLAASMERLRRGPHVISAVGGVPFPGVDRWIVGYRAGAKHADPRVSVRVGYSNDFVDPIKCRRIALAQIAAGSGVVFNVAGSCGAGALAAAKAKSVWGIGVDVDQAYLGSHILTSAVLHLDRGMYRSIELFTHGRLPTGRDTLFNLRNGGVGLGHISNKVPAAILRRLAAVRESILNGTIVVPRVN
jgi:basic membrane protein A